jgi:twinkle protein
MIHEKHKDWLRGRGIEPVLAEKFGLTTVDRNGAKWLVTPYIERGKPVNHKYRLTSKKRFMMDTNATLCLWNHDILLQPEVQNGNQSVIIAEGEMDALVAIQAGFDHCLSVPNGANGQDAKLEYIDRAKDLLRNVKCFILATDNDEAGRMLQQELARRLGPARCKFLQWPDGVKDLNDYFEQSEFNVGDIARFINSAKPYPVKGLYRMADIPEPPELKTYSFGVPGLSELLSIVPGTLTVMTGFPGHGKTSLSMAIIANLMQAGMAIAMASFETMPKPVMQNRLRASIIGCGEKVIPAHAIPDADKIISDNLVMIMQSVDEEDEMDVEHILDLAAGAVIRDNIRLLFIDPWNEIEHRKRGDESETEYVSRVLRALKRFARDYCVAVWLVAHPTKPDPARKLTAPGLSSISGSANFANKADYGLVSHRANKSIPNDNTVNIEVTKVRMGLPGKEGSITLAYDWRTSSYTNIVTGEVG